MGLNLESMATEQLVRAIYLTLLHSLWQGAAIAGIAGIVMISSKRSSSASRYNFLAGSITFFILCAIATFIMYLGKAPGIETRVEGSFNAVGINTSQLSLRPVDRLFSALSAHSNKIVLLWFLIICLKSIQLYLGLCRVSDLKTRQTSDPGSYWKDRVNTLAKRLGITTAIELAESGLTAIPLTVGHLKPLILVPAGMLTAIPVDQIESILLHELAHIKRKDYFINILQTIVESLFFFNPAIWWLSSLLRAERENCCDDIAIANSSSKTDYVRALVAFEEYRRVPRLAVAFTGNENTLLKRTKRIIYNQHSTLNSMEKFILTSGLVVSGLLSLAFTDGAKERISKTLKPVVSTISETFPTVEKAFDALADTIPAASIREISIVNGGITTFNAVHKGKAYKIIMKDDEVTDLYIDKTKIAKEKLQEYTDAIIEIVQFAEATKIAAEDSKRDAERSRIQSEKSRKEAEDSRMSAEDSKRYVQQDIRDNQRAFHATNRTERTFAAHSITNQEKSGMTNFDINSRRTAFSPPNDTLTPARRERAERSERAERVERPEQPERPERVERAERAERPGRPALPAAPKKPAKGYMPEKPSKQIVVRPVKVGRNESIRIIRSEDLDLKATPKADMEPTPAVKPAIKISPNAAPAIEIKTAPVPPKVKATAPEGPPMGYSSRFQGTGKHRYTSSPLLANKHSNSNSRNFTDQVNRELIEEGLVKDPKNFSYKITNNELIVDGKKQDNNTHNRIISKVLKSTNDRIEYTYEKRN